VYKRDYAFRMNAVEEIFEIRSCIEILANDIKVDKSDQSQHILHPVSKSSISYFAEYFRAGLTDCKNFNGYRLRDNM